jgi:hypothetical protein
MQPSISDVSLWYVVNIGIDRVVTCVQTNNNFCNILSNCCEFDISKSGYCDCNSKWNEICNVQWNEDWNSIGL